MPALAKIYDMVLATRFNRWFKPRQEQAGGQKGRGCEEQVLIVRLLIDIARKTGRTLYVSFIDYQKAYDKLNRLTLLKLLDSKGCGNRFLMAVKESLRRSTGIIGENTFGVTSGVKQGGCTSCPFFTFYIESTVEEMAKEPDDDWLHSLHMLLFMDDTAVSATSKQKLISKLHRLKHAADDIGMIIHPTKSEYICVNGEGSESIIIEGVKISHTDSYVYLGSLVSNLSIAQQIQSRMDLKRSHVFKFSSFLIKNSNAPFMVKKKVWYSALMSAVLYSSESWLTKDIRAAKSIYMRTVKELLGIRESTCNDLVLIEMGIGDVKSVVKDKQLKFLKKLLSREDYDDSYAGQAITLALQLRTPMGLVIEDLLRTQDGVSHEQMFLDHAREVVRTAGGTCRETYHGINTELSTSLIYSKESGVPECARKAVTRLRLLSHRLRIETGRWSHLPRENRLCVCGEVQTEHHVLFSCEATEHLRESHPAARNCVTLSDMLSSNDIASLRELCQYCRQVLRVFE